MLGKYNGIAKKLLITDIQKDGCLSGGNKELYKQIKTKFPSFQIQASGGISDLDDIKNMKNITDFAIVGRAMYENNLFEEIKNYE